MIDQVQLFYETTWVLAAMAATLALMLLASDALYNWRRWRRKGGTQ